jgi:hypothetical protein
MSHDCRLKENIVESMKLNLEMVQEEMKRRQEMKDG